ncbi:hypothetical protein Smp_166360 [Schistosoma mansoni]|uniref:hypothetical protein n=1 Tax=Schistosoma mansoni TaxID=6183 RepID=UPI0001A62113|nr:hypothetical protein Smp_166360 [Schistosoma mansoni]|eukprot:XP_018649376.1 hypothetical protein Smp_166360 [Schistosoma mansoni]
MSRSLPTCNQNKKDGVSSVTNIIRRARYIVQTLSSLLMKAPHIKYSATVCDRNIVVINKSVIKYINAGASERSTLTEKSTTYVD